MKARLKLEEFEDELKALKAYNAQQLREKEKL
jgi:hypothetical protein